MNVILDILFPKKCIGCGKLGSYICGDCVSNILQTDLVCPKCERLAQGGQTHPICQRKFGLDGLWSLAIYENPLKKAIQRLKYEPALVRDFAPVLVNILIEYWVKHRPYLLDLLKKDYGQGWVVIPVPLHWYKENNRGFNQSALLGKLLSKNLGLDYCEGLKRIRHTKPQIKLKGKDRYQNIRNAFSVAIPYTPNPRPFVLLIDDVWTTGSTLKECCYVLKRAGAKKVWAITLAR